MGWGESVREVKNGVGDSNRDSLVENSVEKAIAWAWLVREPIAEVGPVRFSALNMLPIDVSSISPTRGMTMTEEAVPLRVKEVSIIQLSWRASVARRHVLPELSSGAKSMSGGNIVKRKAAQRG